VYRPCIASFDVDLQEPETNAMGSKLKDHFEPYWDDEKDWLCTVEFLPRDDPEARSFSAEIIGYLFGYAHLTNTRSLALLGDPDANPYELLFSFSSPQYNDDMGNDYIENDFMSPTSEEIMKARPLAMVLPEDVVTHAKVIAATICASTKDDRAAS
jgi:hypothetical protein